MYCGGCFRDNALVMEWRRLGHDAVMLPMYLPMTLDQADQSAGAPMFFGGINVFLQQKSSWFGKLPSWAHRLLNSPKLLWWAAGSAAKTRASDVGALTVSMLEGEDGRQTRELNELVHWLKSEFQPDVICLSDALLVGMATRLKRDLGVPVFCLLGGEHAFLDSLPEPFQTEAWKLSQKHAAAVDCFLAPSRYYSDLMAERLRLRPGAPRVVYGGIHLDGYEPAEALPNPPVLGYFARMCKEKGLHTVIDAFIELKQRRRIPGLRLRVGGGLSPVDETQFVSGLRNKLQQHGLLSEVEFCPNLTREQKQHFYRSLSVFSVPALYGEAFGLYLAEAWASGVPVVQPRHAAFPELVEISRAGVICEPDAPKALAEEIEALLLDADRLQTMRQAARAAALSQFRIDRMAQECLGLFEGLRKPTSSGRPAAAALYAAR